MSAAVYDPAAFRAHGWLHMHTSKTGAGLGGARRYGAVVLLLNLHFTFLTGDADKVQHFKKDL